MHNAIISLIGKVGDKFGLCNASLGIEMEGELQAIEIARATYKAVVSFVATQVAPPLSCCPDINLPGESVHFARQQPTDGSRST